MSSSPNKLRRDTPAYEIFDRARRDIQQRRQYQVLEYKDIAPDVGFLVAQSLSEDPTVESSSARVNFNSVTRTLWILVMPTFLHDAHQKWLRNSWLRWYIRGSLTEDEAEYLGTAVGTTITGFEGDYSLSQKEPDAFIHPNTQKLPQVAIEVGWSESMVRLEDDMRLWLLGACAYVERVLILKWSTISGRRIKGSVRVFGRDAMGTPVELQKLAIFPAPAGPVQQIPLTRRQLFGPYVFPGRNPDDVLYLSMDKLRQEASPWIEEMGYTPA